MYDIIRIISDLYAEIAVSMEAILNEPDIHLAPIIIRKEIEMTEMDKYEEVLNKINMSEDDILIICNRRRRDKAAFNRLVEAVGAILGSNEAVGDFLECVYTKKTGDKNKKLRSSGAAAYKRIVRNKEEKETEMKEKGFMAKVRNVATKAGEIAHTAGGAFKTGYEKAGKAAETVKEKSVKVKDTTIEVARATKKKIFTFGAALKNRFNKMVRKYQIVDAFPVTV